MRFAVFIFIFYSCLLTAQDKLFFTDGTIKTGIIISNTQDVVYFRKSDTSAIQKINKNQLILMEDYKGTRYLFARENKQESDKGYPKDNTKTHKNSLSIQPLSILFGRLNLSYERFTENNRIGFVIPLILTFDPSFGNAFTAIDSTITRTKGIKYITGLDVNFYSEKGNTAKLFIGPRIRYGTDVAFFNTKAYSFQTQIGLKVSSPGSKVVQHFSIGFGLVRILSSTSIPITDAQQAHPWYSVNYRLGLKW